MSLTKRELENRQTIEEIIEEIRKDQLELTKMVKEMADIIRKSNAIKEKERKIKDTQNILDKYLLPDCLKPEYDGKRLYEISKEIVEKIEDKTPHHSKILDENGHWDGELYCEDKMGWIEDDYTCSVCGEIIDNWND
ncbi:MAG: hypothetical protein QXO70_05120 [Candidatus Pacearchaeota archaeon]